MNGKDKEWQTTHCGIRYRIIKRYKNIWNIYLDPDVPSKSNPMSKSHKRYISIQVYKFMNRNEIRYCIIYKYYDLAV